MSLYNDPNHFNNTMLSSTTDTITITSAQASPVYTTDNTGSINSGLYWGLNGTSAPNTVLTTGTSGLSWVEANLNGSTLSVKGDADFEGEVTIKGRNIAEMFEKIEERLAILHPNTELEDRWDELKELSKRYKELEAEIIEKERVWAILKK